MSSGEVPRPRRARRGRRGWRIVGLTLLGLEAALVVLWMYADWAAGRRLSAALADLQARGEPLTLAELVPQGVPDEQNAAVLYQPLFGIPSPWPKAGSELRLPDFLGLSKEEWGFLIDYYPHPSPEGDPRAQALLSRPQVVSGLEVLREASRRPFCVFPLNWEDGYQMVRPDQGRFYYASVVLAARAIRAGRTRDPAEAAQWLAVGLRMAHHAGSDSGVLTEKMMLGIMFNAAPQALGASPLPASARAELGQTLAALTMWDDLVRAKRRERAAGLMVFDLLGKGRGGAERAAVILDFPNSADFAVGYASGGARLVRRWDEAAYLGYMGRQISAAETRAQVPDLREYLAAIPPRWPPSYYKAPLTGILAPSSGDGRVILAGEAQIAVWQAALVVYRWREGHGGYPGTLAQVATTESLPRDPFSGQDLIYRRLGPGFVVYSVGRNGRDDGGQPEIGPDGRYREDADFVWQVEG